MSHQIVRAMQHSAGLVKTALATPILSPDFRRTIGPFVIVAHSLPLEVAPGVLAPDFDVRAHPHIGLAAVSYMLDGHLTHRDSLGSRCEVGPGGLNYMIAGRGAVHSERFDRLRTLGGSSQILQILMALPDGSEDVEPSFFPVGAADVPETIEAGAKIRRLAGPGTAIAFPAPIFLHDVELDAGSRFELPTDYPERALYVMSGTIDVDGTPVAAQETAVLAPGHSVARAVEGSRILAFGGHSVGPRYAWWNFIHSSLEKIEAAKAEWRGGRTPLPPGDTEAFTPAPPDDGRPLLLLNAR